MSAHAFNEDLREGESQNGSMSQKSIGHLFTTARDELGLSIKAVADKIHVRTLYLESIEKGEFEKLPSALYAAGFIRLYARYLQLDSEEILRRLDLARENPLSHGAFLHSSPHVKPNRLIIVISFILSFISLGLIFYTMQTKEEKMPSSIIEKSESNKLMPAEVEKNPLQAPVETLPMVGEESDTKISDDSTRIESSSISKDKNINSSNNSILESMDEQKNTNDETNENTPKEIPVTKSSVVEFFAREDCWIELRCNEKILFSSILKKDERYTIDTANGVTLSTGNAPALDVLVNGKMLPPLSRSQHVVKNVDLQNYVKGES